MPSSAKNGSSRAAGKPRRRSNHKKGDTHLAAIGIFLGRNAGKSFSATQIARGARVGCWRVQDVLDRMARYGLVQAEEHRPPRGRRYMLYSIPEEPPARPQDLPENNVVEGPFPTMDGSSVLCQEVSSHIQASHPVFGVLDGDENSIRLTVGGVDGRSLVMNAAAMFGAAGLAVIRSGGIQ